MLFCSVFPFFLIAVLSLAIGWVCLKISLAKTSVVHWVTPLLFCLIFCITNCTLLSFTKQAGIKCISHFGSHPISWDGTLGRNTTKRKVCIIKFALFIQDYFFILMISGGGGYYHFYFQKIFQLFQIICLGLSVDLFNLSLMLQRCSGFLIYNSLCSTQVWFVKDEIES